MSETGGPSTLNFCRHCGYDIRALADDAACPECATPVARSRASALLGNADPDWVRAIARGARTLFIGSRLLLWTFRVFAIGVLLVLAISRWVMPPTLLIPMLVFTSAMLGLAILLCVTGGTAVATPDPRLSHLPPRIDARIVLRSACVACFVVLSLYAAMTLTPLGAVASPMQRPLLALAAGACVVVALALLRVLGSLAERVPAPRLAARARSVERWSRWLLPLPLLVWLLHPLLASLLGGAAGGAAGPLTNGIFVAYAGSLTVVLVFIYRICGVAMDASREIIRVGRDVVAADAIAPAR